VKIISLPPVLPSELDLKALNLALLNNVATLDWSCVPGGPGEYSCCDVRWLGPG